MREEPEETWGIHAGSIDPDGRAHFRAVLAKVRGPRCFGLTVGWDTPTPWMLPYVTVEVLGWMLCLGWTHSFDAPQCAEYERQSCVRAMRRDYWCPMPDGPMEKVAVARVHDCESDEPRPFLFPGLLEEAGIADGDEFEILITATGERPHGDRRYIRDGRENYRPETDDECLRRIEDGAIPATAG